MGMVKKTIHKAEKVREDTRIPRTPENVFLAKLAVVSCAVILLRAHGEVYYTYVPDPPWVRPLTWADPPPRIVSNNTKHLVHP